MKKSTIRSIGFVFLAVLWSVLAIAAWLHPSQELSESERRKLAQFPGLSANSIASGSFMTKFEDYALDQFPLRDTFRQVKSLFHYNILGQNDNNGIYTVGSCAAQLEYPLNEASVKYAANKFNYLYDAYLSDSEGRVYFSIVPDKGYYLAEENSYPALDYCHDRFSDRSDALGRICGHHGLLKCGRLLPHRYPLAAGKAAGCREKIGSGHGRYRPRVYSNRS